MTKYVYSFKEGNKDMRKKAECWEFSNNARGYCSYRDPWNRVELSFKPPVAIKRPVATCMHAGESIFNVNGVSAPSPSTKITLVL